MQIHKYQRNITFSMPEVGEFEVRGFKLVCPKCYGRTFTRSFATAEIGSLFGFSWNRKSENYECKDCGYVFWFLNR